MYADSDVECPSQAIRIYHLKHYQNVPKFLVHLTSQTHGKSLRSQGKSAFPATKYLQVAGREGIRALFLGSVSLSCPVARQIWPNEVAGTLTCCPAGRRPVHWE